VIVGFTGVVLLVIDDGRGDVGIFRTLQSIGVLAVADDGDDFEEPRLLLGCVDDR
jgi:hypothetical protein